MRALVIYCLLLVMSISCFSQVAVKLKVESISTNGGQIYVSIFNNEQTYKGREPYLSFVINSDTIIASKDLNLPIGQYVFSIYQDSNGNGKLDANLFGIPKEKFGFSNYNGKSAPGSFKQHKVEINEIEHEVVVVLYKI